MSGIAIVATSWDDGDPLDSRITELLGTRGLAGTFYVPLTGPHGRPILNHAVLREFSSQGFEIGAHGISHTILTKFHGDELAQEIRGCKAKLQDILGEQVRMFCYPKGRYNIRVIREVKKAGYEGARTTEMLGHRLDMDPYRMSTTLHAYPHTRIAYLKNMGRALHFRRALDWAIQYNEVGNWIELAKKTFDRVIRDGGVWHLYGHSWIIERYNLWNDLSKVLDYVARRDGVRYLTNRDMLKYLPRHSHPLPRDHQVIEQ